MQRKIIDVKAFDYPQCFRSLLENVDVYDSSCSAEAKVLFIDKDNGYFLKRSTKNSLEREALMGEYFHKKGLTSKVISYVSDENDWLLTERVRGEDCTFYKYLENPKMLCDITATLLRELHETDYSDCPVKDRMSEYCFTVEHNYEKGLGDLSLLSGEWSFSSIEEAWHVYNQGKKYLANDTLLHGDYCLPNIVLDDWKLSGFIDLGNGGVGDRHVDLFWGVWTLFYNLKTFEYSSRFIDAYGRDKVEIELLRVISAAEIFG